MNNNQNIIAIGDKGEDIKVVEEKKETKKRGNDERTEHHIEERYE